MPDGPTAEEEEAILAELERELAEDARREREGKPPREQRPGHNRAMLLAATCAVA